MRDCQNPGGAFLIVAQGPVPPAAALRISYPLSEGQARVWISRGDEVGELPSALVADEHSAGSVVALSALGDLGKPLPVHVVTNAPRFDVELDLRPGAAPPAPDPPTGSPG